ncbi:MAG TPA: cysteine peptidase family C39 domain-containing protein, partial [Thermoanaerobaculia bacterium]|nr:cysteine peptidase family C39 domain-containing protein [Thermoanaerobaculia bacterium]
MRAATLEVPILAVLAAALCGVLAPAMEPPAAAAAAPPPAPASAAEHRPVERPEPQRTFAEPLTPVGTPAAGETGHLAAAIASYRSAHDIEAVQPILGFLAAYPRSAWKPSLLANLAVLYRHTGYIDRALAASEEAWSLTKASAEPEAKKIADGALAVRVELAAALGRTEELAALLDEVATRPLGGHAAETVSAARSGLWLMRNDPAGSFRCGPLAVERVSEALQPGRKLDPRLLAYPSTRQGTSLGELVELAGKTGLQLQAVKRDRGSKIPVPAVVHWKAGHFAAIVEQSGDRFLAKDLTFGDDHWVSRDAVEEESTGYALV